MVSLTPNYFIFIGYLKRDRGGGPSEPLEPYSVSTIVFLLLPEYPSEETWLCGNVFTAADINAVILILRLNLVGLEVRYCSVKRPAVCEYVKRLKERSSTKKISAMFDSLPSLFRKRFLKMVGKRMFQASVLLGIAGAGYFIYKKYNK